jgi:hypothetical protein
MDSGEKSDILNRQRCAMHRYSADFNFYLSSIKTRGSYFELGLTNLRWLGPVPLTCRTTSSLISM